ncbi:MAG: phosphoribosylanthranilate isomerase [Syntrophomonadaceae bacterium]|jgi:phosphoribosylanthranilate isomerase|nr:phosphoribosylanthranilate isomerase [Syntrophomonadaceae bacterium]
MVKIKICGLKRQEDVFYANEAEPDYIGFVFAESARRVDFAKAAELREILSGKITPVGVFVNASVSSIIELYKAEIIRVVQLHGNEDERFIAEIRESCSAPVIKAVPVKNEKDVAAARLSPADYIMLDQGTGGSGKSFDWNLVGKLDRPFFLAGGININNLEKAVNLSPYAVDISSGAESGNEKDRDKMIKLVREIRKLSVSL